MNNFKKQMLYFIYIIVVIVLFTYYLFPSDAVKKYVAVEFNKLHPDFNISINFIKPVFPPGLRLYNVTIYNVNNLLFEAEQITITPVLLSLFSAKPSFSFKGKAYEGFLEGNGTLIKKTGTKNPDIKDPNRKDINKQKIIVKTKLYGMNIKNISAIQRLAEREITGILDGLFSFNSSESTGTLMADINISDCEIELLPPLSNLKSISFTNIKTKAVINNKKIQINECIIKGKQADGKISGSVNLKNPFEQSVINLTGNIKPHQLLIENLQHIFPVKSLIQTGKVGIPIRLYGTIEQPGFSLK